MNLDEILAEQSPSGAFRSRVESEGAVTPDENAFVTSCVVLELADRLPADSLDRALRFLESCEDRRLACAYRFYPEHPSGPALAIPGLVPDADDTVLALLALATRGRADVTRVDHCLAEVLEPNRVFFRADDEDGWVAPGAFRTWLNRRARGNPVDACVNANVAALYAWRGLADSPACRAACAAVERGVRRGVGREGTVRLIMPFYAHPLEILYAVRRAVEFGATSLSAILGWLSRQPWAAHDEANVWPRDRPICCNSHGRPIWTAPSLQAARHWNHGRHHFPHRDNQGVRSPCARS